ncbi:hypothetical protein BJX65DRAFT_240107 [Aspergillus insuetus]
MGRIIPSALRWPPAPDAASTVQTRILDQYCLERSWLMICLRNEQCHSESHTHSSDRVTLLFWYTHDVITEVFSRSPNFGCRRHLGGEIPSSPFETFRALLLYPRSTGAVKLIGGFTRCTFAKPKVPRCFFLPRREPRWPQKFRQGPGTLASQGTCNCERLQPRPRFRFLPSGYQLIIFPLRVQTRDQTRAGSRRDIHGTAPAVAEFAVRAQPACLPSRGIFDRGSSSQTCPPKDSLQDFNDIPEVPASTVQMPK